METNVRRSEIDRLNEYVLIKVFNSLDINDKLTCTNVCKRWQRILNSNICQPKRLSVTVNSNVPIKELNNLNCEHSPNDEIIKEQLTLSLSDYLVRDIFVNDFFANLNLLILNLIFCDHSPVIDLSQLVCLKYIEIHGSYYEFRPCTVYRSVEHLFVEKLKPSLFDHFPNLKCFCLNQLKINSNDPDAMSDESDDETYTSNTIYNNDNRLHNEKSSDQSSSITTNTFSVPHLGQCKQLRKFKVNYVPVHFNDHCNDLMQMFAMIAPNLEQLHISLSFNENESDFDLDLNETEDQKIANIQSCNSANFNISRLTTNRTNCTMNKIIRLVRKLPKLQIADIDFDLDHMNNLNLITNFLMTICRELSHIKLRTHLKFTRSLDLNSMDVLEFSNFLKTSFTNQSNEIIINGKCFHLKELKSLLKYYHLINVDELYITNKDLRLFRRPAIYNYLKQVNTLCFEANPEDRFSEILNNLTNVKYIYFDCPAVSQDQINLVPILKPNLEYLAIEEFTNGSPFDLEFALKFSGLRSLYLGKLECLNSDQLLKLVQQSPTLNYLNIECKLVGKSLDRLIELFASNARKSADFYHLSFSLCGFKFDASKINQMVQKFANITNLKITFYQP